MASVSHPAAGAGGHGAVRAWHLGALGQQGAGDIFRAACCDALNGSGSATCLLAAMPRSRCSYPLSCCKGRGKCGEVSGQPAMRRKGREGETRPEAGLHLVALPTLGRSKISKPHLHPFTT